MDLQSAHNEGRLAPAPGPERDTDVPATRAGARAETATRRPRYPTRNRPVDVGSDDSGLLFINTDNSLTGALRVCGETFQCTARPLEGARGTTYWAISGKGDRGDAVTGLLFNESGGLSATGKFRPMLTGRLITVAGRIPRRIAGWVRATAATQLYGLKLTAAPDPDDEPGLPFGGPEAP